MYYTDGRYVAKLAWKEEHPDLPTNHDDALRRTQNNTENTALAVIQRDLYVDNII